MRICATCRHITFCRHVGLCTPPKEKQLLPEDEYPDDNPKTSLGIKKAALENVPPIVLAYLADAFSEGARKYGAYNWREKTVSSSVYKERRGLNLLKSSKSAVNE